MEGRVSSRFRGKIVSMFEALGESCTNCASRKRALASCLRRAESVVPVELIDTSRVGMGECCQENLPCNI